MNMTAIKEKAKMLGIKPGRMKKAELIRVIQTTEGNMACFGARTDSCDQPECCWREDCSS